MLRTPIDGFSRQHQWPYPISWENWSGPTKKEKNSEHAPNLSYCLCNQIHSNIPSSLHVVYLSPVAHDSGQADPEAS